jgi:hypothetical protein
MFVEKIENLKYKEVYEFNCLKCGSPSKKIGKSLIRKGHLLCDHCSRIEGIKKIDRKSVLEKTKATNLKKYGVENVAQTSENRKKVSIKNTNNLLLPPRSKISLDVDFNLLKYDSEYVFICQHCQKEATMMGGSLREKLKIGKLMCRECSQAETLKCNPISHEDIENTCIHCGKKVVLKSFVKDYVCYGCRGIDKRNSNRLSLYGSEEKALEARLVKTKATNLKKYGVENTFQYKPFIKKIQDKIRQTTRQKYLERFSKADFSLREMEFFIKDSIPYFKCKKCGDVWEAKDVFHNMKLRCFKCYPINTFRSRSADEVFLFNLIKKFYPDAIHTDTSILKTKGKSKEIDIYIPSKKIAIEFDGIYWHSELAGKDKHYHINKTEACERQGIRLIHVWENELGYKENLTKETLCYQLGITGEVEKVQARKCTVKEIDEILFSLFCEENHLQGAAVCKIKLGLFYNEELLGVMGFSKSRYDPKYKWELVRNCFKLSYNVIGGSSKLLSYFEKNYHPQSVISYCDRRWFTGVGYQKMGFKLLRKSPPSYQYFLKDYENTMYPRQNFMKTKLAKKLPIFDENLTEWENMQLNGYNRIWDCGHLVFVKEYQYSI